MVCVISCVIRRLWQWVGKDLCECVCKVMNSHKFYPWYKVIYHLFYRINCGRCCTWSRSVSSTKFQLSSVTENLQTYEAALLFSSGWGWDLRCFFLETLLCPNEIILCVPCFFFLRSIRFKAWIMLYSKG